jgi:hypothetical protein
LFLSAVVELEGACESVGAGKGAIEWTCEGCGTEVIVGFVVALVLKTEGVNDSVCLLTLVTLVSEAEWTVVGRTPLKSNECFGIAA